MKRWQEFEHLVAAIHRVLNAADYDIEVGASLVEPLGAKHQIDVLLRPRTPFAGPILVSCKAWSDPVGVDHVREWSDIVQHTGAASGVIVAEAGFTSVAMDAARNVERRVSLWKPRPLTIQDFGPDADSPDGYIARVEARVVVATPRLVEGSFKLDISRADGLPGSEQLSRVFCFATRDQWYLRDDQDNVVENLWDLFVARGQAAQSRNVEVAPREARFLVLDGVRMRFNRMAFVVQADQHEIHFDVDLLASAFGYENVLTGKVQVVPLPPLMHR